MCVYVYKYVYMCVCVVEGGGFVHLDSVICHTLLLLSLFTQGVVTVHCLWSSPLSD